MDKTSYKLPDLDYPLDGLEPVISKEALDIHYFKHHQAYVNNLNKLTTDFLKFKFNKEQKIS